MKKSVITFQGVQKQRYFKIEDFEDLIAECTVKGLLKKSDFAACVKRIRDGNKELSAKIMKKAEKWKELILLINPSLSNENNWHTTEFSEIADPALLAEDVEKACFSNEPINDQASKPKEGVAGGAYRIVINTDVPFYASPEIGAAAVGALVLILREFAPVEVLVQQAWLGTLNLDKQQGGTISLFKVLDGSFDPALLAFWVGDPEKDCVFSHYIHRFLFGNRGNQGCARTSVIETDLFVQNWDLPQYKSTDEDDSDKVMAEFLAKKAAHILFFEQGMEGKKHYWNTEHGEKIKKPADSKGLDDDDEPLGPSTDGWQESDDGDDWKNPKC